jgi:hypothetical protein
MGQQRPATKPMQLKSKRKNNFKQALKQMMRWQNGRVKSAND